MDGVTESVDLLWAAAHSSFQIIWSLADLEVTGIIRTPFGYAPIPPQPEIVMFPENYQIEFAIDSIN